MSTSSLNPLAIIRPLSDGVVAMAVVTAMSKSIGFMGMAAFTSPQEELKDLNKRISRLLYVLGNQREAVRSTRIHKVELMHKYGLTVLPSVVEMARKYPALEMVDHNLRKIEKDLDRMELSMMFLQRRRKELQIKLGVRVEEEEVRRVYPAMKKFTPPPGLGD